MSEAKASDQAIAHIDGRSFFERALSVGIDVGSISRERVSQIKEVGAKGIVQIAGYFGSAHLRKDLELAMARMVYLISLALESQSGGSAHKAALLLAEHGLLTFSKVGSNMLRALHAKGVNEHVLSLSDQDERDFLNHYTIRTPLSLKAYEQRMQLHDEQLVLKECAQWLGQEMGLGSDSLDDNDAASIIRSCLFTRAFAEPLARRKQGPIMTSREFQATVKQIEEKGLAFVRRRWSCKLYADVPDEYQTVIKELAKEMIGRDFHRIANAKAIGESMHQLLDYLSALYFRRYEDIQSVSDFDELVSDEWQTLTKGRRDDDSISTLLLCAAAGQKWQAELSLTSAKNLIKALRRQPPTESNVSDFIENHVPVPIQADLRRLWKDELLPELHSQVLVQNDVAMERALRFLREHACMKTAQKPH